MTERFDYLLSPNSGGFIALLASLSAFSPSFLRALFTSFTTCSII